MSTTEVSRRDIFAAAGAVAVGAATLNSPANAGTWETSLGYPDSHWHVLDPEGANLRVGLGRVDQVKTGFNFVEGPVWFGAWGCVIFSDLYSSRQHMWNSRTGEITVFRTDSNFTNGAAKDREGRLISCEAGLRRVTRIEFDGTITVVADKYNGKKLNSPNDVVVKSDGSIWFTDPPNGLRSDAEGHKAPMEQPGTYVYRVEPKSGNISVVINDISPNGLCFSPDESKLYALNTTRNGGGVLVYDVVADGTKLANRRMLISNSMGSTDGFRCDDQGNLWCGWNGPTEDMKGVRVFSPEGKPLLHLQLPENAANLCFAGGITENVLNRIFICAQQSVYTAWVNVRGAKLI